MRYVYFKKPDVLSTIKKMDELELRDELKDDYLLYSIMINLDDGEFISTHEVGTILQLDVLDKDSIFVIIMINDNYKNNVHIMKNVLQMVDNTASTFNVDYIYTGLVYEQQDDIDICIRHYTNNEYKEYTNKIEKYENIINNKYMILKKENKVKYIL